MAGVRRALLADEQVAGPRVDERRTGAACELDLGERPPQSWARPRGEASGLGLDQLVALGAPLLPPGRPASVEHPRVAAVEAERPRDARSEDPVVVVVGDDEIAVADTERAGAGRELLGRRHLYGTGSSTATKSCSQSTKTAPGT